MSQNDTLKIQFLNTVFLFLARATTPNYNVVDTDYNTYSIVYTCSNGFLKSGKKLHHMATNACKKFANDSRNSVAPYQREISKSISGQAIVQEDQVLRAGYV